MFIDSLSVGENGHLYISGCDTVELAKEYGTPLYVMSEDKVREVCRRYVDSFKVNYQGNGLPIYASKAFSCKEIYKIVVDEGLDVEVVSGGELYTALQAGVSPAHIHFQGNNKSYQEIEMAIDNKVADIVIDNLSELARVQEISKDRDVVTSVSIRVKPGIDAHTHDLIRTGQIDSKFGVALENGDAFSMVEKITNLSHVTLTGLHCHIGSQIHEIEPFVLAAKVMLDFYADIYQKLDVTLKTLNLGGGFGIKYTQDDNTIPYEDYMKAVSKAVHAKCEQHSLVIPKIMIEPGRSVVGEAGITLYTVGDVKEIPEVRNYVAIDGGMFENPRYSLYKAEYTFVVANRAGESADYIASIAGKCCETDLLQEHTKIQKPHNGEILASLSTGAYNFAMASNYNRNPRPAVVVVTNGESRLAVRRETYEDIMARDL
ncbi:diaminopimelate decarboxylase [Scatolibacter rhodanostii]|uniref:diaminopimelate decarboxylase n=1 Tax=Scatolibacter rhodanostii TaxID=2014781 RepID=UPI000C0858A3|nr:diaminopimelate decarboxylase [Scatolibacter rhodanostii]